MTAPSKYMSNELKNHVRITTTSPQMIDTNTDTDTHTHDMNPLDRKQSRLLHLLNAPHISHNLQNPLASSLAVSFDINHLIKSTSVAPPAFHYYTLKDGTYQWCP